MTPEEAFGKAVQELRRQRRLSQEGLAFAAGLHRTYISLLERGQRSPKLATIFRLAEALDVRASEVVALSEEGMRSPDSRNGADADAQA